MKKSIYLLIGIFSFLLMSTTVSAQHPKAKAHKKAKAAHPRAHAKTHVKANHSNTHPKANAHRKAVVHHNKHYRAHHPYAMHRNITCLNRARILTRKHHYHGGFYALAVRHQRYAHKLYIAGNYQRAMYHAHAARVLAFKTINANSGTIQQDWNFTEEENTDVKGMPDMDELAAELPADNLSDEDALNILLEDLDVE